MNLIWQRLDDKKACRIKCELDNVHYLQEEEWPEIISFLVDAMKRLVRAFREPIQEVRSKLQEFVQNQED